MGTKKAKFNVLMMRDDSPVRRYRLSPGWLKTAIFALLFLVLLAGGGGWAGYTFWQKNRDLRAEKGTMERQLRDANMELERLQNIDKILKSNDPEDMQSLLGSMSAESPRPAPTRPPLDLRRLFTRVDLQQVSVDNLQAKYTGNGLQVIFNLNNLLNATLSGDAVLTLITTEGKELQVKLNRNDLSFQIQRFKQIRTVLPMPPKHDKDSLFGLRLKIANPKGQTIFSETYPLSYIQA